jgi:hypothetical protein
VPHVNVAKYAFVEPLFPILPGWSQNELPVRVVITDGDKRDGALALSDIYKHDTKLIINGKTPTLAVFSVQLMDSQLTMITSILEQHSLLNYHAL